MTSPTEIPGFSGFVADLSLRERSVVPTEWTSEIVADRMVEMFRILRAMPAGSTGSGGAWPAWVQDMGVEIERDPRLWSWGRIRVRPTSDEIRKAEETAYWPIQFLGREPGARRCLYAWSLAIASKASIRAMCERRGWARATLFRKKDIACRLICDGLSARRVEVRSASYRVE